MSTPPTSPSAPKSLPSFSDLHVNPPARYWQGAIDKGEFTLVHNNPAPEFFDLYLEPFLQEGEQETTIGQLLERLQDKASLAGHEHGERLMREPEIIPKKWEEVDLLLPGTVVSRGDSTRLIPYMHRLLINSDGGHTWFFGWIHESSPVRDILSADSFGKRCMVVRCKGRLPGGSGSKAG